MDTLIGAVLKLDHEEYMEFLKEYFQIEELRIMDDNELWEEIDEATRRLNHHIRIAVMRKNLKVDVEVGIMDTVHTEFDVPVLKVTTSRPLRNPKHHYAT